MKLPSYVQCETVFYRACAKILFWIILASNYTHLQWLIAQYTGDLTAHLMTAVVEVGLGVKTYELIRRVTENARERYEARKKGTKEENIYHQPTLHLWGVVLALGTVSALGNIAYFFERGQPVRLMVWSGTWGVLAISVLLGVIAPCLTAMFAFGEGEKIAVALFIEERKQEKEEQRQARLSRQMSTSVSNGSSKAATGRKSREDMQQAILAAFTGDPFHSITGLAGELGCVRQTIYNHLGDLEDRGLVRRVDGQGVQVLDRE